MTGVSQEPMISLTAKTSQVVVTQTVPWTPSWDIASARLMWKVLLVASANHYIGIWPKKTPMDVQNASATWREQ